MMLSGSAISICLCSEVRVLIKCPAPRVGDVLVLAGEVTAVLSFACAVSCFLSASRFLDRLLTISGMMVPQSQRLCASK